MRLFNRKGKAAALIPIIVSAVLALGYFAYSQLNTSVGYVALTSIEPGTKITRDHLNNGDVVIKQIPKDIANSQMIPDFEMIEGRYVSTVITPGQILTAYNIAKTYDLRTNKDLVNMNLRAVAIPVTPESGLPNSTKVGDRVNLFGVFTYEIANMAINSEGQMENLTVSSLPSSLKELFIANGYEEDSVILNEEVTVTKQLLQNVPVVSVESTEDGEIKRISVGLGGKHAELVHQSLSTGKIGFALLPFNDNGYIEEVTDGVISTLELNISETFKTGDKLN